MPTLQISCITRKLDCSMKSASCACQQQHPKKETTKIHNFCDHYALDQFELETKLPWKPHVSRVTR